MDDFNDPSIGGGHILPPTSSNFGIAGVIVNGSEIGNQQFNWCTQPDVMGLSCRYKVSFKQTTQTLTNINDQHVQGFQAGSRCDDITNIKGFPARIFFTGSQDVALLYPLVTPELLVLVDVPSGILNQVSPPVTVPINHHQFVLKHPLVLSAVLSSSTDTDSDTILDVDDNCPNIPNTDQLDTDNDGFGNVCDDFPNNSSETTDTDNDGVGDNSDAFPNDPTETTDSDNDGTGDNSDPEPNNPDVGGTDTTNNTDNTDTGTASTSNSCDVAPTCTGDTLQCAAIIQSWENACINFDSSVEGEHAIETMNYEGTATSFTERVNASGVVQSFSNVSNLISFSNSSCPPLSIDLQAQIGATPSTNIHCDLLATIETQLSLVLQAVYVFIGFRILASA
ncbi:MAG: hypothetical protein COB50_04230 [Thiotrichales bacterium]|nr:MAG: hypothetical protein COB50_04230 [Thiotrichales bacterium]